MNGLENDLRDSFVAGLKGLLSAIPMAGGLVAELVAHVIPGQRQDRFAAFLLAVDERVRHLERYPDLGDDGHFVDVFEDASLQSLRAISPERTAYLANLVANAAQAGTELYDVDRRLLAILEELTDTDVEVLRSHTELASLHRLRNSFYAENLPISRFEALSAEEKNAYDAKLIGLDLHINTLVGLGLLEPSYRRGDRRDQVELDAFTGRLAVEGHEVSILGRLLLRRIGSPPTVLAAPAECGE